MSTFTTPPSLFRSFAACGRRIAAAGTMALLGIAIAGTAVAAPATLSPQVELEPGVVGAVHWTATSGETSSRSTVLEAVGNADQFAAKGFEWTERSDSPCWAELRLAALANTDGQYKRYAKCAKRVSSRKIVSRAGANEVITGLQICLTDKKSSSQNRLKGVRLWGRTVDPETAELGPINGPSHAQRKHCAQWSRRVNCPAGEVATKFRIFGSKAMQGISLGCRAVGMRPAVTIATINP